MNLMSGWLKFLSPLGQEYPVASTVIAALIGAILFGGGWWGLVKIWKEDASVHLVQHGDGKPNKNSGDLILRAGDGGPNGDGGNLNFRAGDGGADGDGGSINFRAGDAK
jgi:hypothetical protein